MFMSVAVPWFGISFWPAAAFADSEAYIAAAMRLNGASLIAPDLKNSTSFAFPSSFPISC